VYPEVLSINSFRLTIWFEGISKTLYLIVDALPFVILRIFELSVSFL